MYPRKGVIRVGSDADLVVWDPNESKVISASTHHHKADFNIFEGMRVFGKAVTTFSNGEIVWDGKNFLHQHKGKYVNRGTFGYTYRRHSAWTESNDPLKQKVDRSNTNVSNSNVDTNNNEEILRLREQVKKLGA